jgi:hypothetical protein
VALEANLLLKQTLRLVSQAFLLPTDEGDMGRGLGGGHDLFPFKLSLSPSTALNTLPMSVNAGCIILENHAEFRRTKSCQNIINTWVFSVIGSLLHAEHNPFTR